MKKIIFCCFIGLIILTGCNKQLSNGDGDDNTINYVKAKELIINNGAVMVDVRSEEEYNEEHIDGALLLPVDEISDDKVKNIIKSKDDVIIVYCKSGVRSSEAVDKLKGLGYNNVYNFGAMSNWKD